MRKLSHVLIPIQEKYSKSEQAMGKSIGCLAQQQGERVAWGFDGSRHRTIYNTPDGRDVVLETKLNSKVPEKLELLDNYGEVLVEFSGQAGRVEEETHYVEGEIDYRLSDTCGDWQVDQVELVIRRQSPDMKQDFQAFLQKPVPGLVQPKRIGEIVAESDRYLLETMFEEIWNASSVFTCTLQNMQHDGVLRTLSLEQSSEHLNR